MKKERRPKSVAANTDKRLLKLTAERPKKGCSQKDNLC